MLLFLVYCAFDFTAKHIGKCDFRPLEAVHLTHPLHNGSGCVAPPLPISTALFLPHAWLLLLRLLLLRDVPPEVVRAAAVRGVGGMAADAEDEGTLWAALGAVRCLAGGIPAIPRDKKKSHHLQQPLAATTCNNHLQQPLLVYYAL